MIFGSYGKYYFAQVLDLFLVHRTNNFPLKLITKNTNTCSCCVGSVNGLHGNIKYSAWRDNADVFGQQMNSLPTLSRCPPHRHSLPTEKLSQREEQAGVQSFRMERLATNGRLTGHLCTEGKGAGASPWQRGDTASRDSSRLR